MKKVNYLSLLLLLSLFRPGNAMAQQIPATKKMLEREYNLLPQHSKDTQYFEMESRLQKHAPDGTPTGLDIYRIYLRCVPARVASAGDQYTCMKYTVQAGNAAPVTIPSLANWSYYFSLSANKEQQKDMFGIDHAKFENLLDEKGKPLPVEHGYHVYNSFIDFHTMNVFSERSDTGKGVQHLKHVGDKIIHSASFSQPTVSLGSQVLEGSYFKNGQITLLFKGLSLVNGKVCAILEYDSGESSFYMRVKPMPNMEVPTKGSSHYFGDIFKSLDSGWLQQATLHEIVISETSVPGMAKINSVIERTILINNVKHLPR